MKDTHTADSPDIHFLLDDTEVMTIALRAPGSLSRCSMPQEKRRDRIASSRRLL
jgi:hypothetical protein